MFKGQEIQSVKNFKLYAVGMEWSERLRKATEELGWSKAELSRRSGISYDNVNKYLRGDIAQPRGDAMDRLARAVGVDPRWLRDGPESLKPIAIDEVDGPVPVSTRRVPYGGSVGAGGFLPVEEYNQDLDGSEVPPSVIWVPGYDGIEQFAWRVKGTSMNERGIVEGMWVVAAKYMDYLDKIGELYNGQVVIVERLRHGGSEIERTIKEVQFARGGMRLIPRSTDKSHREIFVPLDAEADNDTEEVRVLAVALSWTHVELRYPR